MPLAQDLSHLPRPAKTNADGWAPDPEPRFVQLLAEQWRAEDEAAGPKARAFPEARFRHSDAGGCARAIALSALDVPPSDPMDLTGVWNTRLGTLVHDAWQEVLRQRFPGATVETRVRSADGEGAGHIDAVIHTEHDRSEWVVAFELKTIGGFGFKMAVGERGAAQGPKHEHQVQAALNGKAVDADEVVIGYLSKEAISVNAAAKKGISELGRFCAEWTMTREQFLPLAEAEEARVLRILELVDEGTLPARVIPSPELPKGHRIVDPASSRWEVRDADGNLTDTGTTWNCSYCRHQTLCVSMPSGRCSTDEIPVELGRAS